MCRHQIRLLIYPLTQPFFIVLKSHKYSKADLAASVCDSTVGASDASSN